MPRQPSNPGWLTIAQVKAILQRETGQNIDKDVIHLAVDRKRIATKQGVMNHPKGARPYWLYKKEDVEKFAPQAAQFVEQLKQEAQSTEVPEEVIVSDEYGEWVDLFNARQTIYRRTGALPQISTVNSAAAKSGRIRTKEVDGKLYYAVDDLDILVDEFLRLKGDKLSVVEAHKLFNKIAKQQVNLEQFQALVNVVGKPRVASHIWRQDFFTESEVREAAETFSSEELQRIKDDTLLTTRQALSSLKQRLDRDIPENTFFQMVRRGQVKPAVKPVDGHHSGFKFLKSIIDNVVIRERGGPKLRKDQKPQPVDITTSTDMDRLAKKYGKIINTDTMMEIIREKTGREYQESSAQRLLERHGVFPIARSGRALFYAEKQVMGVKTQPGVGKPPQKQRVAS